LSAGSSANATRAPTESREKAPSVLVKVNFLAVGSFEEAKAFGRIKPHHRANGLVFVSLNLSLHATDMTASICTLART
jgi:hypothetical protein